MNIKKQYMIGVTLFVMVLSTPSYSQDIASSLCHSTLDGYVQQFFDYRRSGAPISWAIDLANTAPDRNLQSFLRSAAQSVYQNPENMRSLYGSGQLMQLCIQRVRGY